jgi:hypothetical protein
LPRIEDAVGLLERGELAPALGVMLEVWRACRDPDLAEAIELLGSVMPARPITATREQIVARFDRDDPADFELLASLPISRSIDELIDRMRRFARRSADPRLATLVLRWLASPPFYKAELWNAGCEVLVGVGDPRSPRWSGSRVGSARSRGRPCGSTPSTGSSRRSRSCG